MKTIHKVVAIFAENESVLVLSSADGRLTLPMVFGKDPYKLSPSFGALFGYETEVSGEYPKMTFTQGDVKTVYHPFVTALPSGELPEGYELLDYDGFEKRCIEPVSFTILCRHFFFLPLLNPSPRTIPLEPEVADILTFRLDCIEHYKRRIPRRERNDFLELANSIASPTRLSRAFHYLEHMYGFSEKEYLQYRDDVAALREDIR